MIKEGERSRDILVVTEGGLVVEREGNPPAVLAQMTGSTDSPLFLGEMAYFGEEPRSASVRCVGACLALRLTPDHVDMVLDGFPGLTRIICRQFTQRLREASQALAALRSGMDLGDARRMLEDGEALFRAGEPAQRLYQLVVGRLRIEAPEDLPGGFIELGPWLTAGNHSVSAFADGSAFLAELDRSRRPAFLRRFPEITLALLDDFARR
jgi:CRP-like cAMP-binding protein